MMETEQFLIHVDRLLEKEKSLRTKIILKDAKEKLQEYIRIKEKEKD